MLICVSGRRKFDAELNDLSYGAIRRLLQHP